MEVCCTLGMLEQKQAEQLKTAGLTAYNHNLDTSREYYPNVITTRSYDERLKTLELVRDAGISVCSGTKTSISSLFTSPFDIGILKLNVYRLILADVPECVFFCISLYITLLHCMR
jgi:hypothetical protein